jgi:SAM-dependent methyltransferase
MSPQYIYPDRHDVLSAAMIRETERSDGYWATEERAVLDRLIGWIASMPGGRVRRMLDAGCGDGRLIPVFAPYAEVIVAIDPDAGRVAAARGRVTEAGLTEQVQLMCTTIEAFIASEPFDIVLCSHIIQHVGTAAAPSILRALARAVAPNGRVAILTARSPDGEDRFVRAELVADRHGGTATYREVPIDRAAFDALVSTQDGVLPIRFFADATLETLLHGAGLEIVDLASFHGDDNAGDRDRYIEARRGGR